jgi:hypothetical protein
MTWEQLSDINLRYDNGYKPKINNGYIYIYIMACLQPTKIITWEIGAIFSGSPCELPYPSHPIRVARKGRGMSEGSWTLPCTRLVSLGARRNMGIDDEHII